MEFLIRRKVLIGMLFTGLTLLGYVSYRQLPVELYPDPEYPFLIVQVVAPMAADPAYLENETVIPLEEAVSTLEGLEKVVSRIDSRQANITVYFKKGVNLKLAYLRLEGKVAGVRGRLPEGMRVQVVRVDRGQMNRRFMELQVTAGGGVDRVRALVEKRVRPALEDLDGIAEVQVYGGRQRSLEVRLDRNACKAYGVTPAAVRQALSRNAAVRTYAGNVHDSRQRWFVHVAGGFSEIAQIRNIVVGKGPVLLKDVAEVYFGLQEENSISRVDGKNAVTVVLVNDTQTNLIDLSHRTEEVIDELNRRYGQEGLHLTVQSNVAATMERNIDRIMRLALIGGVLAVLVLWLFLKNLRVVAFVALSLPISVLTAFNLFYAYNITLNSFTLIGMVLAIGMLLDNSVVVLENIYRHAARGEDADTAVLAGTGEVWRSVFAATLTTVMVFLPFLFSQDMLIRLLGREISISIISTLVVSLLVALLFIPMVTHTLLRRQEGRGALYQRMDLDNKVVRQYLLVLKTGMRHPAATVVGATALFFVTVFIAMAVNIRERTVDKSNAITIYVRMTDGATLATTDRLVKNIEEVVMKMPEKEHVMSNIRQGEAVITVRLREKRRKGKRDVQAMVRDLHKKFRYVSNATLEIRATMEGGARQQGEALARFMALLGMGHETDEIVIRGSDYDQMQNLSRNLEFILHNMGTINFTYNSVPPSRPVVRLYFDPLMMVRYDIDLAAVSQALNSFPSRMNTGILFRQGDDRYEIVLRERRDDSLGVSTSRSLDDLRHLQVRSRNGTLYELQSFAKIDLQSGKGTILRKNQSKELSVFYMFIEEAYRSKRVLENYRREVETVLRSLSLPEGTSVELVRPEDPLKEFYFLVGAAILLIYMILASVFESFTTPLVLMFSIPLAAVGAFVALVLTGHSLFNVNTLTGFIILVGIVVNNGILLIDYTNILRRRGYGLHRALVTAGISRLRPILITAITTIVAMLPLALGNAEYVSAIGAPFAITVMGGLASSTLLTLVVVPVFYLGLEGAMDWIATREKKVKWLMGVLYGGAVLLVMLRVDNLLWRALLLVVATVGVPAAVWFVQTSLRSATRRLIPDDEPIRIVLQRVVKIYDRPSRVVREWEGARRRLMQRGVWSRHGRADSRALLWQLPLLVFSFWFTYFHIQKGFWILIFSVASWLLLRGVTGPWLQRWGRRASRLARWSDRLLYWLVPAALLVADQLLLDHLVLVILTAMLWYFALTVVAVARKMEREKIVIEQVSGRLGRLRRTFYRMVAAIPLLGRRKEPFKALRGVSLEIGTGMFGLLGPNGAGKTTLMRIVCGIYDQSYGKVWINGYDTARYREELQGYIGYLPQEFGMYENMTAWDFLEYMAMLKGLTDVRERRERLTYVLKAVNMYEHRDEEIGSFSGGMKQRIGIAQILLHLPRILVVDEPTAGIDPRERIRFRNLLVELSRERIVLFSTHIIEDIASSCNRVAVIDRGEVKYVGDPQAMTSFAEGKVWQADVSEERFRKESSRWLVVHHMKAEGKIRVRLIAREKPLPEAVPTKPLLEDAYLCLLKGL